MNERPKARCQRQLTLNLAVRRSRKTKPGFEALRRLRLLLEARTARSLEISGEIAPNSHSGSRVSAWNLSASVS